MLQCVFEIALQYQYTASKWPISHTLLYRMHLKLFLSTYVNLLSLNQHILTRFVNRIRATNDKWIDFADNIKVFITIVKAM